MNPLRVCIKGTGIVCALGKNGAETLKALELNHTGIKPLTRFNPSHVPPLPVGEIPDLNPEEAIPVTHQLARMAADQAIATCKDAPDGIVLGVTTGGIATTEVLLKENCTNTEPYRFHAIGSVAEDLARRYHCKGPVITVSTACSSGSGAMALALAMLRSGRYQRILAGGVDSLCRLTYYGFRSLQLIDPEGPRPMDQTRRGMAVAEGAGMLLLETTEAETEEIQILGAGLSCDAHHPAQPHPEGLGAFTAMEKAMADAGIGAKDIDYINLHGTGTLDNDRSEAKAVKALFGQQSPPLSSIKGATGHSLAAAGAIEAVIATLAIERGLLPANTGCKTPDPALELTPVMQPTTTPIHTVLSNSFGFGGNNATVVIGRSQSGPKTSSLPTPHPFTITGWSAVTGAGHTEQTLSLLQKSVACTGRLDEATLCESLPPRTIRRLKRLSQMAMALSVNAEKGEKDASPGAVFFGTGWGSLSETHDFLQGLFETKEKFSSPTDFIGSVHNAPAGQIALRTQAKGANITVSGSDYSFEQALFSAQLLHTSENPVLVLGADEGHDRLSPLFDPSVAAEKILSDGGGALMLQRTKNSSGPFIELKYFRTDFKTPPKPDDLVKRLGGPNAVNNRYGLILAGIPAALRKQGQAQLDKFIDLTNFTGKVIDYRRLVGEYATASAVATVLAASLIEEKNGVFPKTKAVLVMGLGSAITAIDVASS